MVGEERDKFAWNLQPTNSRNFSVNPTFHSSWFQSQFCCTNPHNWEREREKRELGWHTWKASYLSSFKKRKLISFLFLSQSLLIFGSCEINHFLGFLFLLCWREMRKVFLSGVGLYVCIKSYICHSLLEVYISGNCSNNII